MEDACRGRELDEIFPFLKSLSLDLFRRTGASTATRRGAESKPNSLPRGSISRRDRASSRNGPDAVVDRRYDYGDMQYDEMQPIRRRSTGDGESMGRGQPYRNGSRSNGETSQRRQQGAAASPPRRTAQKREVRSKGPQRRDPVRRDFRVRPGRTNSNSEC